MPALTLGAVSKWGKIVKPLAQKTSKAIVQWAGVVAPKLLQGTKIATDIATAPVKSIVNTARKYIATPEEISGIQSAIKPKQRVKNWVVQRSQDAINNEINLTNSLIRQSWTKPTDLATYKTAIKWEMEKIGSEINRLTGQDLTIDITPSTARLRQLANSDIVKTFDPADTNALIGIADRLEANGGKMSLSMAEEMNQWLNSVLKDTTVLKSEAYKRGLMLLVEDLRNWLDDSISSIPWQFKEIKKAYWALRNVYGDTVAREIVFNRQNMWWLVDSIGAIEWAGNIVSGGGKLLMWDKSGFADIGRGIASNAVGRFIKSKNDPNNIIRAIFEKWWNKSTLPNIPNKPKNGTPLRNNTNNSSVLDMGTTKKTEWKIVRPKSTPLKNPSSTTPTESKKGIVVPVKSKNTPIVKKEGTELKWVETVKEIIPKKTKKYPISSEVEQLINKAQQEWGEIVFHNTDTTATDRGKWVFTMNKASMNVLGWSKTEWIVVKPTKVMKAENQYDLYKQLFWEQLEGVFDWDYYDRKIYDALKKEWYDFIEYNKPIWQPETSKGVEKVILDPKIIKHSINLWTRSKALEASYGKTFEELKTDFWKNSKKEWNVIVLEEVKKSTVKPKPLSPSKKLPSQEKLRKTENSDMETKKEKTYYRSADEVNKNTDSTRWWTWYGNKEWMWLIESHMSEWKKTIWWKNLYTEKIEPKNPLIVDWAILEEWSIGVINSWYWNFIPKKYSKIAENLYSKLEDWKWDVDWVIMDALYEAWIPEKQALTVLNESSKNKLDAAFDLIIGKWAKEEWYDVIVLKDWNSEHIFKIWENNPIVKPSQKPKTRSKNK